MNNYNYEAQVCQWSIASVDKNGEQHWHTETVTETDQEGGEKCVNVGV